MLLGRGTDAPMSLCFSGMGASGLIGLFIEVIFLVVAYRIFMDWLDKPDHEDELELEPEGQRAETFWSRSF